MYDVAIAALAMPAGPLSATIDALAETHPTVRILVGLGHDDHDARAVVERTYPEVQVVAGSGMASIRSGLVAMAGSDYVFFLEPGFTIGQDSDVANAIEVMRTSQIPLGFAAANETEAGGSAVAGGLFRCSSDEAGVVAYEPLVGAEVRVGRGHDTPMDADLGNGSFVVDRAQVGPGATVDWDARFNHGLANRDLFTAIVRHPQLQAKYLPGLTVDQTAGGAAEGDDELTDVNDPLQAQMLARYLRKWGIHTEHFGPSQVHRHVASGHYSGMGVRVDARSLAGSMVASRWKHPRTMVRALAKSLTTSKFNHYVVSESADMLVNNMIIAPDGSWIHVGASHCESAAVRGWLTQVVTGLAPRRLFGVGLARPAPDGLFRPRDIGLAATVSLLESPETLKFTVVTNPYRRAAAAFAEGFSDEMGTDPAAEALRNHYLHESGLGPTEDADYDFTAFLRDVNAQADHERDRQWRGLSTALAWGRVNYDVVGRTETLADDMGVVAERLGLKPPKGLPSLAGSGPMHSLSDVDAELVRRIYSDDFDNFGYSLHPSTNERPGS